MLPYRDSRITIIFLGIFFVAALGYAFYEAQGLIFGPIIEVPERTTLVRDPYVVIQGTALRISSLSMDGRAIPVSETGVFSQPYLLTPGYNRIVLDATDSWGRTREDVVGIMYQPSTSTVQAAAQEMLEASSSAATSSPHLGAAEAGASSSTASSSMLH